MATVYKIEIETVSPWCSYPPEQVKEMLEKFFEEFEDENAPGNKFENTEIEVVRTA